MRFRFGDVVYEISETVPTDNYLLVKLPDGTTVLLTFQHTIPATVLNVEEITSHPPTALYTAELAF